MTVICPTYNRGPAILDTLESVRQQTFRDWELLVVSDASDDDTDEIVARFCEREPRARLIRSRRYGSQSGPTNLALREAAGDYIAYIDHDDKWRPQHLSVLWRAFASGARFAATRSCKFDQAGSRLATAHPLTMLWHPQLQLMNALFENSCAGHHIELAEAVGGWYESDKGLEDWDLWLRFADLGARCSTTLEVTVELLEDVSTRHHSLVSDGRHELARYPDMRSARADYRALSDQRRWDEQFEACRLDMFAWYGGLADAGELAFPAGWAESGLDLQLAIVSQLEEVGRVWGGLVVEPVEDHYALSMVIGTMRPEHAERYAKFFRSTMLHQQHFLDDLLTGQ